MKKGMGALCLLCLSVPVLFGFETLETIGPKLYSAPLDGKIQYLRTGCRRRIYQKRRNFGMDKKSRRDTDA